MVLKKPLWSLALLVPLASLLGCGPQPASSESDLMIRGGSEVLDSDMTAIRLSTVALTSDYKKPENADKPSILELGKSFCTGTIIGPRLVVTAAHCIQELKGRTEKGGLIFPDASHWIVSFDLKVSASGRLIRAAKVIPHADWNPAQTLSPAPSQKPNDIGLIILSEDIPSDHQAATIADAKLQLKDTQAALAGYGVTKDRNNNDTGVLRSLQSTFTNENGKIARITHGAWFKGICAGDSGGPAYAQVEGQWQLVGAASTGAEIPGLGCAGTNSNSTDVRYYKEWIARFAP